MSASDTVGAPEEVRDRLYDAVRYVLGRIQQDPDARYVLGWVTEAFRRLCVAEAAHLGRPFDVVERERRVDLQPHYRRREADVVLMRPVVDAATEAARCDCCECSDCCALRKAIARYEGSR